MARIGNQIHRRGPSTQPGPQQRQDVAHRHHQCIAAATAPQQRQTTQQVEHLALEQFRELAGQAGVAQAAGAVTAGMAQHGDALAAVGIAVAHEGQGLHRHAQSL